jgi:hypothetical protein
MVTEYFELWFFAPAEPDVYSIRELKKRLPFILAEVQPLQNGGADGTRTRDLRRDRPAF